MAVIFGMKNVVSLQRVGAKDSISPKVLFILFITDLARQEPFMC